MSGIATEALKDVVAAEERVTAIQEQLDHQREQFDMATKELRAELDGQKKLISSRLREAAAAYNVESSRPAKTRKPRAANGSGGSVDEKAVVAFIRSANEPVGAGAIAEGTGITASSQTLSIKLKALVDAGTLKRSGQKRGTRYELAASS